MSMRTIGTNEALILAALTLGEGSISTLAERMERHGKSRAISDGAIFVALGRMTERKLVVARKTSAISQDGRSRLIGHYEITALGAVALAAFQRDAESVQALTLRPIHV